jgi:hypothetical protein
MLAVPASVFALIIGSSGNVYQMPPPPSVVHGAHESDTQIIAFNEPQFLTLLDDVTVNISAAGMYDDTDTLTPEIIPALTVVNSHFLHLDPVETNWVELEGSVTFNERILGVIVLTSELDDSDEWLGNPTTSYPTAGDRGLELDAQADYVLLHGGMQTMTVHLETCCKIDQIRVLTAAVEDPLSVVTAQQRNDASKLVDINYTLTGEEASYSVTVDYSIGGGPYTPATAVWGDVGDGVAPGAGAHIVWSPALESSLVSGGVTVQVGAGGVFAQSGPFTVVPSAPGDLSGTVNDPDGATLDGVTVVAVPGLLPGSTTDGEYTLGNVPAGKTTVTFTLAGYHEVVREVTIREASTTILNVVMARVPLIQGPEVVEVSSKYTTPDRHVYYIRDVPLQEEFTARIDWHEGEYVPPYAVRWYIGPPENPRRDLVYNDNDHLLPPPPKVLTHTFEMGSWFLAGDRLTVVAVSFAVEDPPEVEWPSQPYLANFDVIAQVDALPQGQLVANTSGSTLKYDLREDAVDMTAFDDGADNVGASRAPSNIPFFGAEKLSIGAGGDVNGDIRDDGTIETTFDTGLDMPETDVGPMRIESSVDGRFLWDYLDAWTLVAAGFDINVTGEASFYTYVWFPPPVYYAIIAGFDASMGITIYEWGLDLSAEYRFEATVMPWVEGVLGIGIAGVGDLESYLRGGAYFDFCLPKEDDACANPCLGRLQTFGVFVKAGVRIHWMSFDILDVSQTWPFDLCGGQGASPAWPVSSEMGDILGGSPTHLGLLERATLQDHDARVMRRDYLGKPYDIFVGNSHKLRQDSPLLPSRQPQPVTVETPVVQNAFPRSIPSLAAIGDDLLMVYVADDIARTAVNGTTVVSRRGTYLAGTYTWDPAATPLGPDQTPDYRPQVATEALNDAKNDTEIVVSKYTGIAWGAQDFRSINSHFDHTPRIAAADAVDGTVMLIWVSEAPDPVPWNPTEYALHWDFFDGNFWTGVPAAPNTITSGTERIIDTALAYKADGSEAILLFTKDPDNHALRDTTVENRDLYGVVFDGGTGTWGSVEQLTDVGTGTQIEDASPQVAYDSNGDVVVVWNRCRNLYSATLDTATPALTDQHEIVDLSGAFAAAGDFRLAAGPAGALALVWQSTSAAWQGVAHDPDDHGSTGELIDVDVDIWYAVYTPPFEQTPGLWSHPLQLTHDGPMERSMSVVYVGDPADPLTEPPQLVMAYNKVDVRYAGPDTITWGAGNTAVEIENVCIPTFPSVADLYVLQHTISGDLSVAASDISVSPPNPRPGTAATITALVRNLRDIPAAGIAVSFSDNGVPILPDPVVVPGPLVGGDVAEASISWPVPPSIGPHDIRVDVAGGVAEDPADLANNAATIEVLVPDLVITDILAHAAGPDRLITVRVANVGALPVTCGCWEVVLHRDASDGPELARIPVLPSPPLAAGAFHDVSYRWVGADPGQHRMWAIVDEDDWVTEFDETNNTRFAVVSDYTGACCNPDSTCDNGKNAVQCSSQGGAWQGLGTVCTPKQCASQDGACCYNSTCVDVANESECDTYSGSFQGHGTVCTDSRVPCCVDGACVDELAPICCSSMVTNGVVALADCTVDSDSDGILCDNCDLANASQDDCQPNGIGDVCDIAHGASQDCQPNGIPDECEPDCNGDGVPDACESFTDCQPNGIPDECEADCDGNQIPDVCEIHVSTPGGPFYCTVDCDPDCNTNGIPDNCEPDCSGDGVPDDCEVPPICAGCPDCNTNGIPDECEPDCNHDGTPDECEVPPICPGCPDCNENEIPDDCELDCNASTIPDDCEVPPICAGCPDCNTNGIPDECEPDCDSDTIPDACELPPFGPSADCNENGIPDECDIDDGTSKDCNVNTIPDSCDMRDCAGDPACDDCNANAVPDGCDDCNNNGVPDPEDISQGTSNDCNTNCVPDECEPDCNDNSIADECDIRDCAGDPACDDCNANNVPDWCDIHVTGFSTDFNETGIPDECEQPPTGACCLQDAACTVTTEEDCVGQNGVYQGQDSSCGGMEACCDGAAVCYTADAVCCVANGDTPQGPGEACTEPEACCFSDNTCQMFDPLCCVDQGGVPQGSGSQCLGMEACCDGAGVCYMADATCCLTDGHTPQGVGTDCTAPDVCGPPFDPPDLPADPRHQVRKNRYISVNPSTNPGVDTALKVEVAEMRRCVVDPRRACLVDEDCDPVCTNDLDKYCDPTLDQCDGADCIETGPCVDMAPNYDPPLTWLVQQPQQVYIGCRGPVPPGMHCGDPSSDPGAVNCCTDEDWIARLSHQAYVEPSRWQDYDLNGVDNRLLHIGDCPTVPCVTYHVYACDPQDLDICSEPLEIATQRFPALFPFKLYADVAGGTVLPGPEVLPPDGYVNVKDLMVTLLTMVNYGTAIKPQAHPTWVDLHGLGTGIPPNYILGVADLQAVYVFSLTRGLPYVNTQGGLDPQDCP